MNPFEDALKAKLVRNEELARERAQAELEWEREQARLAEQAERREQEVQEARRARHAELVEHLQQLLRQLDAASPESFAVRSGWKTSGEEFVAEVSSVRMRPARTLFVQLDRDDDQVLARWTSDIGESLELWRLLEFSPEMLDQLFLQAVDQELWQGHPSPPPFPGNES